MLAESEFAAEVARQRLLNQARQVATAVGSGTLASEYTPVAPSTQSETRIAIFTGPGLGASGAFAYGAAILSAIDDPRTRAFSGYELVKAATSFLEGPESISRGLVLTAATRDVLDSPIERFRQEKVRSAKSAVRQLTESEPAFARYSLRMNQLIDGAAEEYPETDIPAPVSIEAMAKLLSRIPRMSAPNVSLLPSGALWLSWNDPTHGRGGLAIFRDVTASFAMLLNNPDRPTKPIHINISGDLNTVVGELNDSARARWITDSNHAQ